MSTRAASLLLAWVATACGGGGSGPSDDGGGPGDPDGGGPSGPDAGVGACGVVTTFADGLVPTAEVHVATNGSDATGDGSAASPFATLDRGLQGAGPGTAVILHAGTYDGGAYADQLVGSAEAPLWIGGAPGEDRPVISGGGEALHVSRGAYLVIHDLEISGQTSNGINFDDGGDVAAAATHIVFRNLFIHDVGGDGNQDCLKLSGLSEYWVLDSEFARCGGAGSGSGIDHVGCSDGTLVGNHFHELSGNAVQCKGGSHDIHIDRNLMVDSGERAVNLGGSTGFEFFRPPLSTTEPNAEARRIFVTANVIVGGVCAVAFVGCRDCEASHNTIIDPERWPVRILQETVSTAEYTFEPSGDSRFLNNLVSFERGSVSGEEINVGAGTEPASFTFSHNLWYAHDDPGQSAVDTPVAETGALVGVDPMFADADHRLAQGSPAIGAGASGVAEAPGDKDGRCWADPPSIGAYEGAP